MYATCFQRMQDTHPLVDCITNIVTAGDVANGLLAVNASPVMASAPEEITSFVGRADALLINLGATTAEQREAMLLGAAEAARLGKPVIVDPVGIGASPLRQRTLTSLLQQYPVAAIRGNISEIKALAGISTNAGGVDASEADLSEDGAMENAITLAQELARTHHTVVAISGPRDIITDGQRTLIVTGGNINMTRVTGTGCTLTGIVAAFVAANPTHPLEATAAAIALMCMAGDEALASERTHGTASFRVEMIDALSNATPDHFADKLHISEWKGAHS